MQTQTQTSPTTVDPLRFHPTRGVRCLYVRNRHNIPVGLIMAVRDADGTVRAGWSVCAPEDNFVCAQARQIAHARLQPVLEAPTSEVSDTPMNRALAALVAGSVKAPPLVVQAARRALRSRAGA